MTGGEALAGIVLRLTAILHSTLNEWVNVTNTGAGGNQLDLVVVPVGVDFARSVAGIVELWVILLNGMAHIPLLGADIARLAQVLLQ